MAGGYCSGVMDRVVLHFDDSGIRFQLRSLILNLTVNLSLRSIEARWRLAGVF